ncbi:hypothetical protein I6I18_12510 [Kytococcus sedentarius]|uniref:Acetyltransferase (Isoleucine patch superfamily) n=1 Tax=Kytococcus sedentarius (strain ATCC 14392 / DSM 20547 / JCM 11482 / CCUG 33030 / NBRC 15357 / NCTC 11040 / CCM 314 / 541) TaxID=478801 RepID=C7NJL5_KYTSD|nr:GDSL-type esterase/lipase family protein [Kytococcus sedentarius]ACV05345.1 acetyltransferase (isoleucine patch superfamily) [Kytococcus sedentarius DSM 20547]QQB63795.1 hypothetical protein I6I18_12510 [Kytococcus sedentarius]STX13241.1 Putative acetyltransferase SACOL2570 [Kytococcus sedentarius]
MSGSDQSQDVAEQLRSRFGDRIVVGEGCTFEEGVTIEVHERGMLVLGRGVAVRRGTTVEVGPDAVCVIGDHVTIGENVFMYVMCGVLVGEGCGISNMVDIHDHNHRERRPENLRTGALTPWDSGFDAAPVVIDPGAIISNKVSLVAGVRVGANTIVGANAVVSRSLPPNSVAVGVPARVKSRFEADVVLGLDSAQVRVGFVGTSIMEHYEAYAPRMFQQWNLPAVGESVTVESRRNRGYPERLVTGLAAAYPDVRWSTVNASVGGATSRDLVAVARDLAGRDPHLDVTFVGCGVNDVWRGFQGRLQDAVGLEEYRENLEEILESLESVSHRCVVIGETPFGPSLDPSGEMNAQLVEYGEAARAIAARHSAPYIDLAGPFRRALAASGGRLAEADDLWGDGVHLSDLGDELVLQVLRDWDLAQGGFFEGLLTAPTLDQHDARAWYRHRTQTWTP